MNTWNFSRLKMVCGISSYFVFVCPAGIESDFSAHPEDTVVHEGETTVLLCSPPLSLPAAAVAWTRDGEVLDLADSDGRLVLAPSGNLYIVGATPADAGMYRCVATNPVTLTTRRSSHALLTVLGRKPSFTPEEV